VDRDIRTRAVAPIGVGSAPPMLRHTKTPKAGLDDGAGCGQNKPQRYSGYGVPDGGSDANATKALRRSAQKLLDLSRRNPMLNYKHRAGSRRQLRIVHTNLESAFAELTTKQRELPFAPLPEPDDIPEDELTDTFNAAFGRA
jgi:uncharacterized protein DUF4011